MILDKGSLISTRKDDPMFLKPCKMRELEWFRPPGFEDNDETSSYGQFQGFYEISKNLKLLNLGSSHIRKLVLKHTCIRPWQFDPDEQYSSHESNIDVHKAIVESCYFDDYHGTIISHTLTDEDLVDELCGPEEVVLFVNRVGKDNILLVNTKII